MVLKTVSKKTVSREKDRFPALGAYSKFLRQELLQSKIPRNMTAVRLSVRNLIVEEINMRYKNIFSILSDILIGLKLVLFNRHHSVVERTNSVFVLARRISTILVHLAPRLFSM